MKKINSFDDISESTYFLFKHSNSCPISQGAYNTVKNTARGLDIPFYMVVIQDSRTFSDEIAQRFDIQHESPQIFFIKDGEVAWHESHYSITRRDIERLAKDQD